MNSFKRHTFSSLVILPDQDPHDERVIKNHWKFHDITPHQWCSVETKDGLRFVLYVKPTKNAGAYYVGLAATTMHIKLIDDKIETSTSFSPDIGACIVAENEPTLKQGLDLLKKLAPQDPMRFQNGNAAEFTLVLQALVDATRRPVGVVFENKLNIAFRPVNLADPDNVTPPEAVSDLFSRVIGTFAPVQYHYTDRTRMDLRDKPQQQNYWPGRSMSSHEILAQQKVFKDWLIKAGFAPDFITNALAAISASRSHIRQAAGQ